MAATKRNPYAAALSHGCFKPKKVKPKRGKGSYSRKEIKRER
jgi:stalled ribosome alternative rescue factor ArfA